jgi:hypothetical protein
MRSSRSSPVRQARWAPISSTPVTKASRWASLSDLDRRHQQTIGQFVGDGESGAVVVGDLRCRLPSERGDVAGSADRMGDRRRDAGGDDGQQVHAAAKLTQDDHVPVGASGRMVGEWLGGDAGEQWQRRSVDRGDDRLGSIVEPVEHVEPVEPGSSETVGAGQVGAGGFARLHDLCGRTPDRLDDARAEVAERRDDHVRLDVAEHAASAEEVEPEAVEAEFLSRGQRVGVEVEAVAGLVEDGRGLLHDLERGHRPVLLGRQRPALIGAPPSILVGVMPATDGLPTASNFVRDLVRADNEQGTFGGRVQTRFPPEPNGYLHIGHAKAITLDFGIAKEFGGICNLRFDDTNPDTEDTSFVDGIIADLAWLGFPVDGEPLYASDYFEQLYEWAELLITKGLAYVDDQDAETISAQRGGYGKPGVESPWRDRPTDESLDLFRRMRAGEFAEGSHVLRAKIDMQHENMQLRDPVMYRIRGVHHHRTGALWNIYPTYDWAHGQSDAIEGVTHSLCTLEFDSHRALYDWYLDQLPLPFEQPRQTEFARLELTHTDHVEAQAREARRGRHRRRLGRSADADAARAAPSWLSRRRRSGSSASSSVCRVPTAATRSNCSSRSCAPS